jgi:hypothetical protein
LPRPRPLLLALGATLCAVNIWTGAPLVALWIGSRIQGAAGRPSMIAVFTVIGVLGLLVVALVIALARLSATYDAVTGRPPQRRRTSPWLRSMRAERRGAVAGQADLGAIERIVIAAVVLGVAAFEVWFFFFSGSSLGSA